jgi:hypothetical protein
MEAIVEIQQATRRSRLAFSAAHAGMPSADVIVEGGRFNLRRFIAMSTHRARFPRCGTTPRGRMMEQVVVGEDASASGRVRSQRTRAR